MSPYTFYVLIGLIRPPSGGGSDSFTIWIVREWNVIVVEVDVLFISYYNNNHWSLFVLNDECFLSYDSSRNAKLHDERHIHIYLTKMWATWKGFCEGSMAWKVCTNIKIWKNYDILEQLSNWEHDYYVLKCIMEICTRIRSTTLDL